VAKPERIGGFDGLRALAFLEVFGNHKFEIPQRDALGCIGVWTFFALSGFLITGILARSREDVEARGLAMPWALGRFYLRRTARIFPVYYLVVAIALIVSAFVVVPDFWTAEKLSLPIYATNFVVWARGHWIGDFGHLWSLAVEEQFYLLFAPLVLILPRSRTLLACLAFVTVGLVTRLAMEASGTPALLIYVNSLVNFGLLGWGGLVYLASVRLAPPAWLVGAPAQACVALFLFASPLLFGAHKEAWMRYGPAFVLLAGLLLFQVVKAQRTAFVAFLDAAPLRRLGRISYAAYLFHPFIHFKLLQTLLLAPAGLVWTPPRALQILVEFALAIGLSTLSWILLERPILNWAARITGRAPFVPAAIASRPSGPVQTAPIPS
jgi:peptidoglycan/LPS O-acetylase OafA/YrhL